MIKKIALAGFIIFIFSNFTGISYGKGKIKGNLQVIYKSCECGMTHCHEYRCYAPFHIKGNRITGDFERKENPKNSDDLYLMPLAPTDNDKQIIKFSYKCPPVDDDCPPPSVNGLLIVHKLNGKVIKIKGKKMLHFVLRLSIPSCTMIACGYENDCSMEAWSDEFLAPIQDGYHTKRSNNAQFDYIVNLRFSQQ